MEICVESLEDGAIDPGPEAWAILKGQIDRISRLSMDLGAVSAAEEGRLNLACRPVDPAELVHTAVLAARDGYDRKQVDLVEGAVPPGRPQVFADPSRIGQVLANLLSNALRHTPSGGGVTIELVFPPGHVLFRVIDNGDGIAAEHIDHVFERFYRADTARDRGSGGTGVGLAISLAIATAHNGTLTARSGGAGTGATLTLQLPALPGGA
jgi:signal transduction histidine kinase